jgi:PPOX class probable F420-dependent enzyme
VTAVWFLLDDDGLPKMSLNSARQKLKNLQRHPECTLFILDPATPYRTIEIRGQAELTEDPDYTFARKVASKYGGMEFWTHDQPGEKRYIVTIYPVKVNTWG